LLLYLLLDQRVQFKLQKELDEFKERRKYLEGERHFKMVDRSELPYTNAVINVGNLIVFKIICIL